MFGQNWQDLEENVHPFVFSNYHIKKYYPKSKKSLIQNFHEFSSSAKRKGPNSSLAEHRKKYFRHFSQK